MLATTYSPSDILSERDRRIEAIRAVLASRSLFAFTQFTFPEFKENWHHRTICEELDAWIAAEDPYNLMVFTPPRHGKTELCCRRLVPYLLGRNPDAEIILASYGADLVNDASRDAKSIMRSEEYALVFPDTRLAGPRERSDNVSRINAWDIVGHRGKYRAAGVGGAIVGRGANYAIIDDPVKGRAQAESKTIRDTILAWYKADLSTRLYKDSRQLMILTRWHHDDLAGHCLRHMKVDVHSSQWKVISLPALFETQNYQHPQDKRTEGEPLWPDRFPLNFLAKQRADLGQYDWHSLYQQRPDLPGGNVFKRYWANEISLQQVPAGLLWVRYWDLAVTKKTKADYTASGLMAIDAEQNIYVRGFIHEQQEWPVIKRLMKARAIAEGIPVGIEAQGTQKGFFQELLEDKDLAKVAMMAYDESKDKLTRALPWVAKAQAGKFYVVQEQGMDSYLDELCTFTGQEDDHDDQVDWTSGAYRMHQQFVRPKIQIVGEYGA